MRQRSSGKLIRRCFVTLLVCCVSISHAFTVIRIRDANFNITVGELITGGAIQSIDEGITTANVSANQVDVLLNPGIGMFSTSVTRSPVQNIFRAAFANGEAPCNSALDITTTVEDAAGNPNRLSNTVNTGAWIGVDYQLMERNRRCRNNGSLRRVNYNGTLTINNINNAGSANDYQGTVLLTVVLL